MCSTHIEKSWKVKKCPFIDWITPCADCCLAVSWARKLKIYRLMGIMYLFLTPYTRYAKPQQADNKSLLTPFKSSKRNTSNIPLLIFFSILHSSTKYWTSSSEQLVWRALQSLKRKWAWERTFKSWFHLKTGVPSKGHDKNWDFLLLLNSTLVRDW